MAMRTIEHQVQEHLGLRTAPTKTLLPVLSKYTTVEGERRTSLDLPSHRERAEYTKRMSSRNITINILETLAPSCEAPIEVYKD